MHPERKRIILSEIKYWKQNKLLPEHYCDFLIALYAQGDEKDHITAKANDAILVKEKNNSTWIVPILYILVSFILLALSLKLWFVFFEGLPILLIGLLMLNCVLWLLVGTRLKLLYFTISGVVGLFLIIVFLFLSY